MRSYIALLDYGAMTASRVSEHANVPYSKIYDVLGSLEKKGWIETERGRPSKYYPKPPVETMATTRMKFEDRFNTSENQVLKELQPLYEKKDTRERPEIWIVRGEYNILGKIRETMSRTRKELLVAAPVLPELVIANILPLLTHLKDKGVSISVMTNKVMEQKALRDLANVANIRVRDHLFGGGVISDSEEVVLLLGEEERTSLAIWAQHIGLAKFAKNYFEYLWETGGVYNE